MKPVTRAPLWIASSLLVLVATAEKPELPIDPVSEPIAGYPGVLSTDYVHSVVEREMRNQILVWSAAPSARNTAKKNKSKRNTKGNALRKADGSLRRYRVLKKDKEDFSGLNDILKTIELDIPEQVIQQDFLGSTATFVIAGQCGNIKIERIGLDYDSKGEDLTYEIDVENLDVDCRLDVEFDFGAYDIEDDLTIDFKLRDNNFAIGVILQGVPPEASSFQGCQAEINIQDIKADGGFSANILNDLDGVVVDIVEQEKPLISQLLCDQVSGFTSVVDGVLLSLTELIEPYLGKPKPADPLELEKNLATEEGELVDFTNSDLGFAITSITNNLDGVFGPYQVNTLIELNLLDENAVFTLDLTESEDEEDRRLQNEECALFRRMRRNLKEGIGRRLQTDDDVAELFTVQSLDIQTIELAGLNSFSDVDLLEIIGLHTFRSKFKLSRLVIKAKIFLVAEVNGSTVDETIEIQVPIEDIEIAASYLVGLSAAAVEEVDLQSFLNFENFMPCALSTLSALGLSELKVNVGEIGVPTVEGAVSSGVDELINTATEAGKLVAVLQYCCPSSESESSATSDTTHLPCFGFSISQP